MFYGELEGAWFETILPEFATCLVGHARLERLATGCRWAEGPAWFGGGRYLIWSDIPNNRLMRFDDTDGSVSVFRQAAGFANGNAVDLQGRLVTCEHLNRRLTRTEHDGRIKVLADRYRGKRLYSPNDLVVKSDGSIWFTDPDYGITADYEGAISPREQDGCHVYRIDPDSLEVSLVSEDFERPNGLAFSRDERYLYVSDTGGSERAAGPRHIRRLEVTKDGKGLGKSKVFATCAKGFFDGFRIDCGERLWASSAEGVHCYRPDGKLIGKIHVPEMVSNVCFGGIERNRLFICGTTSLYAAYLKING
jgi:gluconolactonase